MKLEIECVRDVLLEIEALPWNRNPSTDLEESIRKHGLDAVMYALAKLDEAKYINCQKITVLSTGQVRVDIIYSMTFAGHEFLNSIRDESVWGRIKGTAVHGGKDLFALVKDLGYEILKAAALTELGIK